MPGTLVIDFRPESAARYRATHAIVAVDVLRATTTAVTAVWAGRRCFPVASLAAAFELRARIEDPLLVGELQGLPPEGFDLNNSPARLAGRSDVDRPMILLSTSGTRLVCAARSAPEAYVACLRNAAAQIAWLSEPQREVAVIGAGLREEDRLCCARIAAGLLAAGYTADAATERLARRWGDASLDTVCRGPSADYLRRTGQLEDLDFVLEHVDDVGSVFACEGEEIVALAGSA